MQYVSRATLRPVLHAISSAESRAKFPDTSIYFSDAIKSTSAARERAEGDEIYIRERRRTRKARRLINLFARRERRKEMKKRPFSAMFPAAFRDANRTS